MIHSPRFTVVLDACVLYPAPTRDLLLNLAQQGLFKPRWSDEIQNEWIEGLLKKRPDLSRLNLIRTKEAMNSAFPDANIEHYTPLVQSVDLPDPDDRHVLAAAIRSNADLIVTFNMDDFPGGSLEKYDVEVQHPDEFILSMLDLNVEQTKRAFLNQVERLKNPSMTIDQALENLRACGVPRAADKLEELLRE